MMEESTSRTICDDVSGLLPWLPGDGLGREERHRVLDHLDACRSCREELLFLSELRAAAELAAPAASRGQARVGLARVLERIDEHEPGSGGEERPASMRQKGVRFGMGRSSERPVRGRLTIALPALAAALLVLAVALPRAETPGPAPPARQFQTLSQEGGSARGAAPLPGAGSPVIKVGFRPEVTVAELGRIVAQLGGEVVGGPSPLGIFTVVLPEEADARTTADWLRARTGVSFAEAVTLPPRSAAGVPPAPGSPGGDQSEDRLPAEGESSGGEALR
ncbi:MAG: zf-HC2 domain-containing protein [Holophagales bacterium]|nr:zf-HC2 domain-containing protein [Holophagales bacterium]